jgi:hypothetical protein
LDIICCIFRIIFFATFRRKVTEPNPPAAEFISRISRLFSLRLMRSASRMCIIPQKVACYWVKPGFKGVDHVRGQGLSRFKSGAYTMVREYFEAAYNAAIGH